MISYQEISQAMQAVNPAVTPSEIQQYEQQIQDAFSDRKQTVMHELRTRWITHHQQQPDGLTWMQIVDAAQHHAESQIREEYLADLTAQVVQNQLDEVEDSPHLRTISTQGSWEQNPEEIILSPATSEILRDLWPEKSAQWCILAGALIERLKYINRPYPADWDSPLMKPFEEKIDKMLHSKLNAAGNANT